ncbi:hypothetical protein GWK47_027798 [Chionoecetes opilio]|uniref:Uncharacterized protein n=1 Tax=Chionoecetes opilio TaxID=41210 RepID=A0A8J8W924_CHIOP|nr:hypothetical protein GWK47_027798 [Chionoecetes opilio]
MPRASGRLAPATGPSWLRKSRQPSSLTPLTVHWDGKILPDCDGTRVDRLAILVSGDGVQKLIGVPKLASGTGEAMASAVAEALDNWGLAERVVAMSFDTTAANTGALAVPAPCWSRSLVGVC